MRPPHASVPLYPFAVHRTRDLLKMHADPEFGDDAGICVVEVCVNETDNI